MTEHGANLGAEEIESLRRGLHGLLEMNLDSRTKKILQRLLALIGEETGIPPIVAASIEKMLQSRVQTPEQTALQLSRKIRAGRRRVPLGAPYGRGRVPREKDDPRLAELTRTLMDKVKQATKRRRGGV